MFNNSKRNSDLTVNIKSRKEVLFVGVAYSVTSMNELGFFDVLPFHTNFVTLIKDFIIVDQGLPTEKTIKLDKGILTVVSNTVKIYVGI
jgi:F0F1-type ATP synthase epsilon subunit